MCRLTPAATRLKLGSDLEMSFYKRRFTNINSPPCRAPDRDHIPLSLRDIQQPIRVKWLHEPSLELRDLVCSSPELNRGDVVSSYYLLQPAMQSTPAPLQAVTGNKTQC
jgi:hypothetical protein